MTTKKPLFNLGAVVATPGCLDLLVSVGVAPVQLLDRHLAGDWGDLDAEDAVLNDEALKDGSRLFSAYLLKNGEKVWIITEAVGDDGQRASTCCLRPEDY